MNNEKLDASALAAYMSARAIPGEIIHLPTPTLTVDAAAQAARTNPESIIKSILFIVNDTEPVLAITCGTARVDQRAIAHLYGVGRKRVRLASPAEVLQISGYEVGSMPPFGHRQPLPTLLDRQVLEHPQVFAGGGAENALVRLAPSSILSGSGARIVDLQKEFSSETGASSALRLLLAALAVLVLVGAYFGYQWLRSDSNRSVNVLAYLRNPQKYAHWAIQAGDRCGQAPFIYPTDGFIGFLWGDSFRPGHQHQGLDIFGGQGLNETPIVAAYAGYLTRLPDWKSTVIIRIPSDPLQPGRQIWTYYTHMASAQGDSYISPDFPPGTTDVYVEAGTLLGYQGNYSGSPGNPTGIHLHFSVVRDDGQGSYLNELDIQNTLDPSPYLGINLNAKTVDEQVPLCKQE